MANITIVIPDAQLTRVVDGICTHFNYQSILSGPGQPPEPNPETKNQFAKRMLITTMKSWVKEAEGNIAADNAREAVVSVIDGIPIT